VTIARHVLAVLALGWMLALPRPASASGCGIACFLANGSTASEAALAVCLSESISADAHEFAAGAAGCALIYADDTRKAAQACACPTGSSCDNGLGVCRVDDCDGTRCADGNCLAPCAAGIPNPATCSCDCPPGTTACASGGGICFENPPCAGGMIDPDSCACACPDGGQLCAGSCVSCAPPQTLDTSSCSCTDPSSDPSTEASAWGDPHDSSWDGAHFDFQYVGEFLLVTDDASFVVQARQAPFSQGSSVATVTAVAALVGSSRVEIDAGDAVTLKIDGVLSDATSLPGGGSASTSLITWPDGTSLAVTAGTHLDLSFKRAPGSSAALRGVLGSQDGSADDDLLSRDGNTTFSLPLSNADFANSWRISMKESLFSYAPGTDTTTFTDLTFPPLQASSSALTPAAYEAARTICVAALVTDLTILEDCILDVATTGDAAFAQGAAAVKSRSVHGQIVSAVASADSGAIDLVGIDDGDFAPDGQMDIVIDAVVLGPARGFLVNATTDATGAVSVSNLFNDTLAGPQRIYDPANPTSYSSGSDTPGIAVYEHGRLLNNSDGSLPPLTPGSHALTLEFQDLLAVLSVAPDRYWRVELLQTDGAIDSGPVVTLP
jgi:von Willebrand factor type D domain